MAKSALTGLSQRDRLFVEGVCAGMSAIEAAKYAGSQASTKAGLASHASRWKRREKIQSAIREMRDLHAVDDDGLWDLTRRALRELIQDRSNPSSRARACELMAKLLGKLQPERHEHLHAHVDVPELASPEGRTEVLRLVRIALRVMAPEERAELVREAFDGMEALPG